MQKRVHSYLLLSFTHRRLIYAKQSTLAAGKDLLFREWLWEPTGSYIHNIRIPTNLTYSYELAFGLLTNHQPPPTINRQPPTKHTAHAAFTLFKGKSFVSVRTVHRRLLAEIRKTKTSTQNFFSSLFTLQFQSSQPQQLQHYSCQLNNLI